MAAKSDIPVRDTRDRLIDLLGFGQTYPLRDLPVGEAALTVPFDTAAKIPVDYSQPGVLYQVHFDGEPVMRPGPEGEPDEPVEAPGTGARILLETFKIREDITFDIYAVKDMPPRRAVYLHQTATVKVGLDAGLKARLLDLSLLEPGLVDPPDTAPRLADYGSRVRVRIEASQEGVAYKLVYLDADSKEIELSEADVTGDLGDIVLTSRPVTEDLDIRIRAVKTFDPSEGRETQTTLLAVILPLRVRANPALPVSVQPGPIIDYNEPAALIVAETQQSARYRLYRRQILDWDVIHGAEPPGEVLTVSVPDEPDVHLLEPPSTTLWQPPAGYEAAGDFQAGTGGELRLPLPLLTADSLFLVQVQKEHRAAPDQIIPSAVQVEQAVAILVRPNSDQPLALETTLAAGQTTGTLELRGGQPGVFYHLLDQADGEALGRPAYFHQRDDRNEALNKGLDQLKVEVDMAIARSLPPAQPEVGPARTPPPPPLVETGPLPVGTTLQIRAVKAQTRVKTMLARTASIPALPDIQVEEPIVDYNQDTRLMVIASLEADRYQPFLAGEVFKQARHGNGQDLIFRTDPLTADVVYEMRVTQPESDRLPLTRIVRLPIIVRPDPDLPLSLSEAVIDFGARAAVHLSDSRPGVRYRLMLDDRPVGEAATGTGGPITLLSEPLSDSATLVVQAVRSEYPEASVILTPTVDVIVRPNPALTPGLQEAIIDFGARAAVQLDSSQPGVRYQLVVDDNPVGEAATGTGEPVTLLSEPLEDDATLVVRAVRSEYPEASVSLTPAVDVTVRPDPALTLSLTAIGVEAGGGSIVQVQASQAGVAYRLATAGDDGLTLIGEPVTGNGATIDLPTGPLTETTTFRVRAAKVDKAEAAVELAQTVTVQVTKPEE